MTRSAWWNRPLAAFMALWVALVLGEPSLVHSCPVHDGLAIATVVPGHGASHAAGMAMAAGDDAGHAGAPAPLPAHGGGGHHACTCPGDCSAGSSTVPALPAASVGALVAATYRVATVVRPIEASRPRLTAPHALPFANGPPAATASRAV